MQLFFKRLRKHLEKRSIKYYCVGEYGDHARELTPNGRPHYHALIFYRGKVDRFVLHRMIKDCWPLGIAQVLPVHGAQGYVTKYILKFDKREHLVKPFSLISHGLGIDYLSPQTVLYHQRNMMPFATKPGGYKLALPRYYKDKIFNEYHKLVLSSRSELYRQTKDLEEYVRADLLRDLGINYFAEKFRAYENRLYQSMKLYKQKKKL